MAGWLLPSSEPPTWLAQLHTQEARPHGTWPGFTCRPQPPLAGTSGKPTLSALAICSTPSPTRGAPLEAARRGHTTLSGGVPHPQLPVQRGSQDQEH